MEDKKDVSTGTKFFGFMIGLVLGIPGLFISLFMDYDTRDGVTAGVIVQSILIIIFSIGILWYAFWR